MNRSNEQTKDIREYDEFVVESMRKDEALLGLVGLGEVDHEEVADRASRAGRKALRGSGGGYTHFTQFLRKVR